MPQVYWF